MEPKFVIRRRKGRSVLVDEQILRWRKKCKRLQIGAYANTPPDAPESPTVQKLEEDSPLVWKNLFDDSEGD